MNDDFVVKGKSKPVYTGKLDIKRAIQTRTLKKAHEDQHWVNAYQDITLSISSNAALIIFLLSSSVKMTRQAKIGIGKPKAPISIGVPSNVPTAIVPVGGEDV